MKEITEGNSDKSYYFNNCYVQNPTTDVRIFLQYNFDPNFCPCQDCDLLIFE